MLEQLAQLTVNGLITGTILALTAVGATLVFGIQRIANLAHGEFLTFAAYVAHATLAADAPYLQVFRVTGTVAFVAYAVGLWQNSIWFHRPWSNTVKHTVDGLIYGCLTGGAFGWLWA